ncbi:hypothetical protein K449DRAFT_210334 [Hypoxylon sp. EC38]|nr:hypothetical protein K449DRAFT_210334 [Hypoxylon sp. EC38]
MVSEATMPLPRRIDPNPDPDLDPHDPFYEHQGEWSKCNCGEPAPYLFLALLDKNTGQPIPGSEKRWALCPKSKCGFQIRWEDRERIEQPSERTLTWQLPEVGYTQQGQFEQVSIDGNGNFIGSKTSHASTLVNINFSDLEAYSARILIFPYDNLNFNSIRDNSAEIHILGAQKSSKGPILGLFLGCCHCG